MVGYKALPCSDATEERLRRDWYETRDAMARSSSPTAAEAHAVAHGRLSDYLWKRVQNVVEADRARHPKARRNQPVPAGVSPGSGRALP